MTTFARFAAASPGRKSLALIFDGSEDGFQRPAVARIAVNGSRRRSVTLAHVVRHSPNGSGLSFRGSWWMSVWPRPEPYRDRLAFKSGLAI
ncbi:MAG TPA: hypothetical protein VE135_08445 [Pyrinomonadaceae bacterium]|nr:hypothetical protein [Pyrinomonadaceae bacterium]